MPEVFVTHRGGDRFAISVRDHTVRVDQPRSDGGGDSGPTPVELFVGSVAACVAHYAHGYLARHGLPDDDLAVTAHYEMGERPARVTRMTLTVHIPDAVPEIRRSGLLAVAAHCTLHNTLSEKPEVVVELADGAGDAAA